MTTKFFLRLILIITILLPFTSSVSSKTTCVLEDAYTQYHQANYKEAIDMFSKCINNNKLSQHDESLALYARAMSRFNLGNQDKKVRKDLEAAKRLGLDLVWYYQFSSRLYYMSGNIPKALEEINKAIVTIPKDAAQEKLYELHTLRAMYRSNLNDSAGAIQDADFCLQKENLFSKTQLGFLYQTLGSAKLRLKDLQGARQDLLKAQAFFLESQALEDYQRVVDTINIIDALESH